MRTDSAALKTCMGDVAEVRLVSTALQAALDDGKKRELQGVIQSYFKDWLMTSGNMRQVYDLARMEREEAANATGASSDFNSMILQQSL